MWMRTVTHLQLFRFKCVTIVQQEYHNSISSSRGFCRFFERKCKRNQNFPFRKRFTSATDSSKIPWICYVRVAFHRFQDCFVTLNVLHFIFLHPFCSVFHAFFCMFTRLYAHFKVQQTFVCAFPFHSPPIPQPFSGLQPAFGCTFCNKKQHRQPFQGHLCCAVFLT